MEIKSFFNELTSDRSAKEVIMNGRTYRAKYRGGRGKRLVVLFHPAQPAYADNRPYFLPFLDVASPQISITDPTLEGRDELPAGWYLGGHNENVQGCINRIVTEFGIFIGCSERIYVGGSSGGFASLLYSSLDPNSVAISACPQIDLDTYDNSTVRKFRSICYPEARPEASIKELTAVDLIKSYSKDLENSAIIIVSPGDYAHLFNQIAHLLTAVKPKRWRNILLDVEYHGIPNHSGSIPPKVYMKWVRAAIASPSLIASDIMATHHEMKQTTPTENPASPSNVKEVTIHESDLRMAELLRDYQLRSVLEA